MAISPLSSKKVAIKKTYQQVCDDIDQRMIDAEDYIWCVSCGIMVATPFRTVRIWGHSHNLPKGRFPEFETDPENIAPRCQSFGNHEGCHDKLDSGNIHKMMELDDFHDIMRYRAKVCPPGYNEIVTKIKEAEIESDYDYIEIKKEGLHK